MADDSEMKMRYSRKAIPAPGYSMKVTPISRPREQTVDREGKGDLPPRVGLSDIRSQYKKDKRK